MFDENFLPDPVGRIDDGAMGRVIAAVGVAIDAACYDNS